MFDAKVALNSIVPTLNPRAFVDPLFVGNSGLNPHKTPKKELGAMTLVSGN